MCPARPPPGAQEGADAPRPRPAGAALCASTDGGTGQVSGTFGHKARGPRVTSRGLTLTVPVHAFQTLPVLSLSQQVFRHRWKKSALKAKRAEKLQERGRAAGCQRLGLGSGLCSPLQRYPPGKTEQGSLRDDTGQGLRHRWGLRRQVRQRQRGDRRTTTGSTGAQGRPRSCGDNQSPGLPP